MQIHAINVLSELLILEVQLLEQNLVGPPDGLDLKQLVHGLKRNGLGLGDAEEDKEDGDDHEGGKEEVHAVTPSVEHLHSESGDDKVPEPVVGGGVGLTEGSGVLVKHLRVENPRSTVPRGSVEGRVEVEEEDSSDTARREAGVLAGFQLSLGVGDLDVRADKVHAECATGGTDHEKVSATHMIDEDHQPDKGEGSLDNAKDTSCKEASVCTGYADALEYGRAVVVDGVDTGA